jgi:hypothetical protein
MATRTTADDQRPHFVTLGMFIIDEFIYADEQGLPTGKTVPPQESHGFSSASLIVLLISSFNLIIRLAVGGPTLP